MSNGRVLTMALVVTFLSFFAGQNAWSETHGTAWVTVGPPVIVSARYTVNGAPGNINIPINTLIGMSNPSIFFYFWDSNHTFMFYPSGIGSVVAQGIYPVVGQYSVSGNSLTFIVSHTYNTPIGQGTIIMVGGNLVLVNGRPNLVVRLFDDSFMAAYVGGVSYSNHYTRDIIYYIPITTVNF